MKQKTSIDQETGEYVCAECGESVEFGLGLCSCFAPKTVQEDQFTDGFKINYLAKAERRLREFIDSEGSEFGQIAYCLSSRTKASKMPDEYLLLLRNLCELVKDVHYTRRNYAERHDQQGLFAGEERDVDAPTS